LFDQGVVFKTLDGDYFAKEFFTTAIFRKDRIQYLQIVAVFITDIGGCKVIL